MEGKFREPASLKAATEHLTAAREHLIATREYLKAIRSFLAAVRCSVAALRLAGSRAFFPPWRAGSISLDKLVVC